MDPILSIITVNYNGLADTCALIDTVPFGSMPMEMIVVDNGSADNEAQAIAQRYPHVRTIRSEKNLGFAGGNNLGIGAAKGRYLYFVNNDALFDTPWHVEDLVKRLEQQPATAAVCPKIRFAWDHRPIQFAGYTPLSAVTMRNRAIGFGEDDHGQYDTPHPTPYAHGAAMLVRREAVERAGTMPECYFLYYEELDWSLLFRRAGYDIWYDPCSTVFHKESRSTGQASALRTYYVTRNRLLFARRNMGVMRRLLCYIYIIGVVATRDMLRHALHGHTELSRAVWKGVADFIKMS
ncbi:MAG: glycosyltransferase family 2 protein [Prevotella sp.]|nr:glycosyltransferase family 2 protein [Prevotella sp.]